MFLLNFSVTISRKNLTTRMEIAEMQKKKREALVCVNFMKTYVLNEKHMGTRISFIYFVYTLCKYVICLLHMCFKILIPQR